MADKRRELQTSKYIAAFAITTLIFVIGMVIGNFISEKKLSTIEDLQQDLAKRTISSELQYLLISEHPCLSLNSSQLTTELFDIGTKLDFMEQSRPLDALNRVRDKRVIVELKNNKAYIGKLKSFDIHINIVLDDVEERMNGEMTRKLNTVFIRGDTITVISTE